MKRKALKNICVWLIAGALAGGASLGVASCAHSTRAAKSTIAPSVVSGALDSLYSTVFPHGGCPGAIVEVLRGDSVFYRYTSGLADMSTGEEITDSTVFNVSSASKIFAGVAMLKLAEQGIIDLDAPLNGYLPELAADFYDSITVRHILTHTSGIPDLRPKNPEEWKDYIAGTASLFSNIEDYSLYGMEEEHMKVFSHLSRTENAPGTTYARLDPSYVLLAPLVERVTGMTYDAWMTENIFKPAAMTEAFYFNPGLSHDATSHAYRRVSGSHGTGHVYKGSDPCRWEEYDYGEVPFFLTKANRGLFTSARSFRNWLKALYSGKIISAESLAEMGQPLVPIDVEHVCYGLGVARRDEPGYPVKLYHLNNNGAYSAVDCSWPDRNVHYIILSNRADWNLRRIVAQTDSILLAKGILD